MKIPTAPFGDVHRLAPDTDEWLAAHLVQAMDARNQGTRWADRAGRNDDPAARPGLLLLDRWRRNEPPLPEGYSQQWQEAWSQFLRTSKAGFAALTLAPVTDRLVPLGWRTAVDSDADGDAEADRIAHQTNLQVIAGDVIEDMLWARVGYFMVDADQGHGEEKPRPVITRQSPLTTYVENDPDTGRPIGAVRVRTSVWGTAPEIWLYRPGMARVARAGHDGRFVFEDPIVYPIPGWWPFVECRNRGDRGEYELHLDTLARINDALFNQTVTTKMQGLGRQRALKRPAPKADGDDIEIEIEDDDLRPGPGAMWDLPPGVEIWEAANPELTPLAGQVKAAIEQLAILTQTPLHYISPDAANGSAAGASTMREAAVFRVEDRARRADRALAEVLAKAFQIEGDTERSDPAKIQTIWVPAERLSITDKASAFSQAVGSGYPFDQALVDIFQVRPGDVTRYVQGRSKDLLHKVRGAVTAGG